VRPDVVAGGQDIYSGLQEFLGCLRRDSHPSRGILRVRQDQIDRVFRTDAGQEHLHRPSARLADYVADEEYAHGYLA
jgi:hypothetical protein